MFWPYTGDMTIHQCDSCQQVIDHHVAITVGRGYFGNSVVLCTTCAQPVLDYLTSKGLLLDKATAVSGGIDTTTRQ